MSDECVIVFGASGHGKVVADICQAAGVAIEGFVDDSPARAGTRFFGLPVLGNSTWLAERAAQALQPIQLVLGIGDNRVRAKIAERCEGWGIALHTAIHPSAVVARSAQVGAGTVVMATAVINPDTVIGRGAIINTGAVIEHDNQIGDFCHFSANAATGGTVRVGPRCHIGLGGVILPNLCVGADCIVGAGAVVIRDFPNGQTLVGVPARTLSSR